MLNERRVDTVGCVWGSEHALWLDRGPVLGSGEGRDQEDRQGRGQAWWALNAKLRAVGATEILFLCYQGSGTSFHLRKMTVVTGRGPDEQEAVALSWPLPLRSSSYPNSPLSS